MPIIDLQRRLSETGRIRIGEVIKGTTKAGKPYARPSKRETFRLTSSNRTALEHLANRYGGTVQEWQDSPTGGQWELFTDTTSLDVLIPPERMSFSQFYEVWSGGGCKVRCDGQWDSVNEQPCSCDPENRLCKPHTRLSVMMSDMPGAGMWRLDTQGWNAATEIGGTFELAQIIAQATHKSLLPGTLRLDQRMSKKDGETFKFAVPVLDFDVDLSAIARGDQFALGSGVTPIQSSEPTLSLAEELEAVNHPEEKPKRANSAEPVRPTGIKPHARGVINEDGSIETTATEEPWTGEQRDQIQTGIDLMNPEEKEAFSQWWKASQLPPMSKGLTNSQAEAVLVTTRQILDAGDAVAAQDDTGAPQGHTEASGATVGADQIKAPMISNPQIGKIRVMVGNMGVDNKDVHNFVSDKIGHQISSLKDLTKSEAHHLIDQLTEDLKEFEKKGSDQANENPREYEFDEDQF